MSGLRGLLYRLNNVSQKLTLPMKYDCERISYTKEGTDIGERVC